MKITNANTIKQALASLQLESMAVSDEIKELLERALVDHTIDTTYILNVLLSKSKNPNTKKLKPKSNKSIKHKPGSQSNS